MAHKKGVGSSKNGRESESKRLGVKLFGGEFAKAGNIIVRQRGTTHHPGENAGIGKDHTIYALIDGIVVFRKSKNNRSFISVKRLSAEPAAMVAEKVIAGEIGEVANTEADTVELTVSEVEVEVETVKPAVETVEAEAETVVAAVEIETKEVEVEAAVETVEAETKTEVEAAVETEVITEKVEIVAETKMAVEAPVEEVETTVTEPIDMKETAAETETFEKTATKAETEDK